MKVFRVLFTVAAVAASLFPLRAELLDGIRVVVHDSLVTQYDLAVPRVQAEQTLSRQYSGEELNKKLAQVERDNLDILVNRQLILHEFNTAGYSLPESVIDELVRARIRERFGDEITLTHSLQSMGITKEKFRQQIRDQFIERALREKNVSSEKIIISPHKMKTYYDEHQAEFKEADKVKLRMIMLNKSGEDQAPQARKLAEEILGKLKEGATFADMAIIYSQDSYRNQGGEHGWIEEKVLGKELADAAAALKPGETSGVIESPEACWLILLEEKNPAHTKPLTEVRDQIEKNLRLDEENRLEKQWIERLKKKTYIKSF
jgi:peptidyl-prolyl cis-trans isomerase SurA